MSSDKKTNKELAHQHLSYAGGLLVESIHSFHHDMLKNCRFAADIFSRPTYVRMIELREKFEQTALISNSPVFFDS